MLRSLVFEAASKKSLATISHIFKRSISVTTARLTEKKVNDDKTQPNPAELSADMVDKNKRIVRLHASVCIERMPVITCEMNDLEKRYSNLINQINVRRSLLSNHELRHKKDLEEAAKRSKEGTQQDKTDLALETALDFEDKAQKELELFKFGKRMTSTATELDDASDPKSSEKGGKKKAAPLQNIERVLDKKMILLVHDSKTSNWELPKIEWTVTDHTLRYVGLSFLWIRHKCLDLLIESYLFRRPSVRCLALATNSASSSLATLRWESTNIDLIPSSTR